MVHAFEAPHVTLSSQPLSMYRLRLPSPQSRHPLDAARSCPIGFFKVDGELARGEHDERAG